MAAIMTERLIALAGPFGPSFGACFGHPFEAQTATASSIHMLAAIDESVDR